MNLVELIEKFVSNCAAITGRKHPNLHAPLLSQVRNKQNKARALCHNFVVVQGKKFLENFHEARKSNLRLGGN